MGNRREPRLSASLPVEVSGYDRYGLAFKFRALTVNISRGGATVASPELARVSGLRNVNLRYRDNRGRFRVSWVGKAGTPQEDTVGLQLVDGGSFSWDVRLPGTHIDTYHPAKAKAQNAAAGDPWNPYGTGGRGIYIDTVPAPAVIPERRGALRVVCSLGAKLFKCGVPTPVWATVTDLSEQGCYLEMRSPFEIHTQVEVWVYGEMEPICLRGRVKTVHISVGMGVEFNSLPPEDAARLQALLLRLAAQPQTAPGQGVAIPPPVELERPASAPPSGAAYAPPVVSNTRPVPQAAPQAAARPAPRPAPQTAPGANVLAPNLDAEGVLKSLLYYFVHHDLLTREDFVSMLKARPAKPEEAKKQRA